MFWEIDQLPKALLRECFMSDIGTNMTLMLCRYAVDLVVCVALGCDMFDCVFPTRTAVSSLADTYNLFSLKVF